MKAYNYEEVERDRYRVISDEKAINDFRVRALSELIVPLQEVTSMFTGLALFAAALYFIGRANIGEASSFIVYSYLLLNASSKFGTITGFRGNLANSNGPLDEVIAILDDEDKPYVKSGKITFTGLQSNIEFKDLAFEYESDRAVLKGVSFSIAKGTATAIVGPSGSGKTTLINLLMRFYDAPKNSVFIDGKDIREYSTGSLMKHIALVSQDTLILNASLRDNLAYGLTNPNDKDISNAIKQSRLESYVDKLPNGLDTMVGDRGVQLSGGEKQRLSIARALLKNADILILDEATSSLDSTTEKLIQEAIDDAIKGRTAIVIAHRLATIRNADHIVVLENGECIEQGSLDDLLDNKGLFSELWQQQKF